MKKIKTISMEELDNFGVDESNGLYWKGKKVRTSLDLSRLQMFIAGLFSFTAFAYTVLQILRFGCEVGWWAVACPIK